MSHFGKWWSAEPAEVRRRMFKLEMELRLAADLLESREAANEASGYGRSPTVTGLQEEWKALLDAEPMTKQEVAA